MALYARGAELTRLAVYDGDEIVAQRIFASIVCDHLAQFENLVTHKDFRGRGYGNALIRDALRRSREAGSELSFLTAGLNDWPREWYQRLGYVAGAAMTSPEPLHRGHGEVVTIWPMNDWRKRAERTISYAASDETWPAHW